MARDLSFGYIFKMGLVEPFSLYGVLGGAAILRRHRLHHTIVFFVSRL
jgi:hypothetical protein